MFLWGWGYKLTNPTPLCHICARKEWPPLSAGLWRISIHLLSGLDLRRRGPRLPRACQTWREMAGGVLPSTILTGNSQTPTPHKLFTNQDLRCLFVYINKSPVSACGWPWIQNRGGSLITSPISEENILHGLISPGLLHFRERFLDFNCCTCRGKFIYCPKVSVLFVMLSTRVAVLKS